MDCPFGPLLRKPGPGAGAPGAPTISRGRRGYDRPVATACARPEQGASARILETVSQVERSVAEESVELAGEERAWLEERLREYRDLLLYLHDH